jgi:hypothetical protein
MGESRLEHSSRLTFDVRTSPVRRRIENVARGPGFLGATRSTPSTAAIPVLSLSAALKLALLDHLAQGVTWQSHFEELVREIEAASRRVVEARGKA